MVEYGITVGGVAGAGAGGGYGYGGSGFLDQLEALSGNPIAWVVAAGFVLLVLKLVR